MNEKLLREATKLTEEILKYNHVIDYLKPRRLGMTTSNVGISTGFLSKLKSCFKLQVRKRRDFESWYIKEVELPMSFNGKLIELLTEEKEKLQKQFDEL